MLQTYRKPYPGELYYGYVLRLYQLNAAEGFPSFSKMHFGMSIGKSRSPSVRKGFMLDAERTERYHTGITCFPEIEMIFNGMTPLNAKMPFLTATAQVRQIELMLRGESGIFSNRGLCDHVKNLKVCPCCMEEDRERYGEAYYHTEHHLPGVRVCLKHGKTLLEIKKGNTHSQSLLNEIDMLTEEETSDMSEAEVRQALFMNSLHEDPVYLEGRDIVDIIKGKLEVSITMEELRDYLADNTMCKVSGRYESVEEMFLQYQMMQPDLLMKAAVQFIDFEELKRRSKERINEAEKHLNPELVRLGDAGYLTKYGNMACGHEFFMHHYAVQMGMDCPVCFRNMAVEEQINRMLSRLGDGNYQLLEFSGNLKQTKVLHKTCGGVRKDVTDIIFKERKCKCEVSMLAKDWQKAIDPERKEFIVEGLSETTGIKYADIRHKKCGKIFRIKPAYFMASPGCRVCDAKHRKELAFDQSIKDLTGDEYKRLTPYETLDKPVKMLHKDCGLWFLVAPDHFMDGRRCPLCGPDYPKAYIMEEVNRCTGGTCLVTKIEKDMVFISRNDGVKFKKGRRYVMQELQRPTPSELFPKRTANPIKLYRPNAIIYQAIRSATDAVGYWKAEHIDGIPDKIRKECCIRLTKKGYLKRVSRGCYTAGTIESRNENII